MGEEWRGGGGEMTVSGRGVEGRWWWGDCEWVRSGGEVVVG